MGVGFFLVTPTLDEQTGNRYLMVKRLLLRAACCGGVALLPLMSATLAAQRCNVYLHELQQPLPAHRQPAAWQAHQHAIEWYLAEVARHSAWRVTERHRADLVLVVANYSLFCIAGKTFARRTNWYNMLSDRVLWPHGAANASMRESVLVPLQANMCGTPWADVRGSFRPANVLALSETMRARDPWSVLVSPFVVASPSWLVEESTTAGPTGSSRTEAVQARVPWARRRLLFFSGHVPKLFHSSMRYLLWKQARRDPRVTARSRTIRCTVGAYETCLLSDAELRRRALEIESAQDRGWAMVERSVRNERVSGMATLLATHCHAFGCNNQTACDVSQRRTASGKEALRIFRRRCAPYLSMVNFTDELPDMSPLLLSDRQELASPSGRLDASYLSESMAHRFCLVAPGDTWSTKKIAETVAIGGQGGCIPVLIVPRPKGTRSASKYARSSSGALVNESSGLGERLARFLPYTTWLDWCSIAFLVSESAARHRFRSVIERLNQVDEAEALTKLQALREVRDAFVCRRPSARQSPARPSAPDFLLGMACEAAKRASAARVTRGQPAPPPVAGGDHQRCFFH
jgi:hypothetical protein